MTAPGVRACGIALGCTISCLEMYIYHSRQWFSFISFSTSHQKTPQTKTSYHQILNRSTKCPTRPTNPTPPVAPLVCLIRSLTTSFMLMVSLTVPETAQEKLPKGVEQSVPDSVHDTNSSVSHATGESMVPEEIQKIAPASIEKALPESIHPTEGSSIDK